MQSVRLKNSLCPEEIAIGIGVATGSGILFAKAFTDLSDLHGLLIGTTTGVVSELVDRIILMREPGLRDLQGGVMMKTIRTVIATLLAVGFAGASRALFPPLNE